MNSVRIAPGDSLIDNLTFGKYRCTTTRRAVQFLPEPHEPQKIEITTPWGAVLEVTAGDYLVSEMDKPEDRWPVEEQIFNETYEEIAPGVYRKKAITLLVPLTEIVPDPEQLVVIETLEGNVEVKAGNFFLARGVKNEIWPYPANDVLTDMERIA